MSVVVIGAGVSGLTCAALLLEAGYSVEVWAAKFSPDTTSNVAAAFWYPYHAHPPERVLPWARRSHARFVELASVGPAGVTVRAAVEVLRQPAARPWWADAVPDFRPATPADLPTGFEHGWCFSAPVVDTRRYLPWLHARVGALGGRFVPRKVGSFAEVWPDAEVAINCAGLGARHLCDDRSLRALRGQVVHVGDCGLTQVLIDEQDPRGVTYVIPRGDDCVLGSSADLDDEDLRVRPAVTAAIRGRAQELAPPLARATVVGQKVGLRPSRPTVRLELEAVGPRRHIVHNYGHGGAGVSLSWGCATEVLDLIAQIPG